MLRRHAMYLFDRNWLPLLWANIPIPSARVYATAIVGFVTLSVNGVVLALHCAKGTTRSRKNDVVVGANVLVDILQSSRNILFGVYVLGVYARFTCKRKH